MKKLSTIALLTLSSVTLLTACQTQEANQAPKTEQTSQTKTVQEQIQRVIKESDTSYQAYTEIIINAKPSDVWKVLTDFDNMPSWSSSLQTITGDFKDQGQVDVINGTGDMQMTYHHTIDIKDGESFHWSDPINGMDWLTDDHWYIVQAYGDNQTRFIQKDTFTQNRDLTDQEMTAEQLANMAVQGYMTFDQELKAQVEK